MNFWYKLLFAFRDKRHLIYLIGGIFTFLFGGNILFYIWLTGEIIFLSYLFWENSDNKFLYIYPAIRKQKKIMEIHKNRIDKLPYELREKLAEIQRLIFEMKIRCLEKKGEFCKRLTKNLDKILFLSLKMILLLYAIDTTIYENTREELENNLKLLEDEINKENNETIKEIKRKRLELIKKRLERYSELSENKKLINERFSTIREMVKYLYERTLLSFSSSEIDGIMNSIMQEAETLEGTIKDMEVFLEIYKEVKT